MTWHKPKYEFGCPCCGGTSTQASVCVDRTEYRERKSDGDYECVDSDDHSVREESENCSNCDHYYDEDEWELGLCDDCGGKGSECNDEFHCDECKKVDDDCTCERCSDCEEFIHNCECEEDENYSEAPKRSNAIKPQTAKWQMAEVEESDG